MRDSVFRKQITQAETRMTLSREFKEGDQVMVRDYRPNHPRWQPAVVLSKRGANSYSAGVQKGGIPWRRHADQMVTGSADSLWHNGERAEIIDGDQGPEPDMGQKPSTRNSGGHTHVKPSKQSYLIPNRDTGWHRDQDK